MAWQKHVLFLQTLVSGSCQENIDRWLHIKQVIITWFNSVQLGWLDELKRNVCVAVCCQAGKGRVHHYSSSAAWEERSAGTFAGDDNTAAPQTASAAVSWHLLLLAERTGCHQENCFSPDLDKRLRHSTVYYYSARRQVSEKLKFFPHKDETFQKIIYQNMFIKKLDWSIGHRHHS